MMEPGVSDNKFQDGVPSESSSKVPEDNNDEEAIDQTFLEQLLNVVSADDVENVAQIQRNMLNRFEKTNETLVNCNALGQIHFEKLTRDYRRNTQLFTEMYKDLDWIFHRIRLLKQKLKAKYPDVDLSSINGGGRRSGDNDEDVDEDEEEEVKEKEKAVPKDVGDDSTNEDLETNEEQQPEEPASVLTGPTTKKNLETLLD